MREIAWLIIGGIAMADIWMLVLMLSADRGKGDE